MRFYVIYTRKVRLDLNDHLDQMTARSNSKRIGDVNPTLPEKGYICNFFSLVGSRQPRRNM
jgi:hypothetical protein